MSSRQIDKFCPIHNGGCNGACTFYVAGEEPSGKDAYCLLSEYIKQRTPNNKDCSKRAKPLLEGSDKKV